MKPHLFLRLSIYLFLLAATPFTLSAQKKKVSFNTSTIVPGAQGQVKVKKDKNGNYHIQIDITNLAPAGQLTPAKKTYVAWVETEENGAKNIGQIKSSSSMLSRTRKASIDTVTPNKPTKVFISAEDDGETEVPGEMIVLTTDYYK